MKSLFNTGSCWLCLSSIFFLRVAIWRPLKMFPPKKKDNAGRNSTDDWWLEWSQTSRPPPVNDKNIWLLMVWLVMAPQSRILGTRKHSLKGWCTKSLNAYHVKSYIKYLRKHKTSQSYLYKIKKDGQLKLRLYCLIRKRGGMHGEKNACMPSCCGSLWLTQVLRTVFKGMVTQIPLSISWFSTRMFKSRS